MAASGERCRECETGRLIVYSTRVDRARLIRVNFLRCNSCHAKPEFNKEIKSIVLDRLRVRARSSTTTVDATK